MTDYPMPNAQWGLIPGHMHEGLKAYVMKGLPPGGFLTAVLSNDLKEACGKADSINRHAIFQWVQFLHNDAPALCWGSPDRVEAWIAAGGIEGINAKRAAEAQPK